MTPVSEADKLKIAEELKRHPIVYHDDAPTISPPLDFSDHPPKKGNGHVTGNKTKHFKVGQWSTLAEVKPRELKWLWPGKIPVGMLVIFAGDAGLGKSLMALELAARGSQGQNFLDATQNTVGIFETILLSAEDDPSTVLVPRLMAAGADLARVHVIETVKYSSATDTSEERGITLDSDINVLRDKLQENPKIRLVVVDPLSSYLGSADLNKEQQVRAILIPLVHMAQEFQVAVVCIAHHSKQANRSAQHKVLGAVGVVGASRMSWSFVRSPDDDDSRQMLISKANLGNFAGVKYITESCTVEINGKPTQQPRVKFLCESSVSVETILTAADDAEARKDRPATMFIRKNLPKGAETASLPLIQQAAGEGITQSTLTRARQNLGVQAVKKASGWFWSWPEETE
jgi:archaellum biogenesis ATPase FlaH